jgi:putative heme-binding domain-containing protein
MGLRHGKIPDATAALTLLEDEDSEIRVQALKVLSEAKPTDILISNAAGQLSHKDLRVRTQAGLTLGKLGGKVPFATFFQDAETELRLPWLRHGLVSGLAGTQSSEALLAKAQANNDAQAVFATLALARQKSPLLGKLLQHANPNVVTEAARAIHDDEGIPAAAGALAESFGKIDLPFHAARRALNANLRQGDEPALSRLLTWTLTQPEGTSLRSDALKAMLAFDQPPVLDLVDGTAKKYIPRDKATIARVLRTRQADLLTIQKPDERAAVLELMVKYELDLPFPILLALAEDLKAAPSVRLQTLRLLGRKTDEPQAVVRTLRSAAGEGNPSEVRIEAVGQLFIRDASVAMEIARLIIDSKSAKIPEKQAVVAALRGRTDAVSLKLLQELVDRLASRKLDAGLKLDVFDLAKESGDAGVARALKKYLNPGTKAGLKMASPEVPYELLTDGGDATRGKALINGHLGANCIACHRVDSDEGSEVGPILRQIGGQRTKDEIAESLVEPSAKIVQGFGIETIILKDGTTIVGSVTKESAKALDFKLADGKSRKIAVAAIDKRTPPVSVMPPMLGILTPEEIRDVVAYLSGLKPKAAKSTKTKK